MHAMAQRGSPATAHEPQFQPEECVDKAFFGRQPSRTIYLRPVMPGELAMRGLADAIPWIPGCRCFVIVQLIEGRRHRTFGLLPKGKWRLNEAQTHRLLVVWTN